MTCQGCQTTAPQRLRPFHLPHQWEPLQLCDACWAAAMTGLIGRIRACERATVAKLAERICERLAELRMHG